MERSVLEIFSLFQNAKRFVKMKKEKDIDLDVVLPQFVFDRNQPFMKIKYKSIWNDYANTFFNYQELKLFILYENLFNPKVVSINIKSKDVKNVSNILSEEQLKKDYIFLEALLEKSGFKKIEDFFEFNEDGENVIYRLIKKKSISPMIYIKYIDKIDDNKTNEEYKHFTKIIKKIKQVLTET